MTSPSHPSGFAAYFAAQPTISTSVPLFHGLTSPPRTDSPSDSKVESSKDSVAESPVPPVYGAATPVPTPPTHAAVVKKNGDISGYIKRTWKLVHDPELHPKGSIGRTKPKEIRQSGQGVSTVSDPRKHELSYGAKSSKGKKKHTPNFQKLHYQFDSNSVGPPPPAQIVIWGFSQLVTSEQVQTHFRPFGEIQELDFKVDSTTGASLGVCRIKYKVDKKDMMSGHASAKKAVQEGSRIKLGGAIVQVEFDQDGLKTLRRMGEAVKKRHAIQAAQIAAREQAAAAKDAKDKLLPPPKSIPTGPSADRKLKPKSPLHVPAPTPRARSPSQHLMVPERLRMDSNSRKSIDGRTPIHETSKSRRTSPSPVRGRQRPDSGYRARSPDDRPYLRDRSRSRERARPRYRSRSRDRPYHRDRSTGRDDYRRRRSPTWSPSRERDRFDPRPYSPRRRDDSRRRRSNSRRRDDSRGRDSYHRRRSPSPTRSHRRSITPPRNLDDHSSHPPPPSSINEYRPAYSARFRHGVDDKIPVQDRKAGHRELTPNSSSSHRHRSPVSDRDEDRGRPRKRSPVPRTRTPSDSRSPGDRRHKSGREHNRPRSSSSGSGSRSPSRLPLLTSAMSQKLGGRPYIFISDHDLPVRRFSSRDLGLCFKKFHPSVYDDSHGFYIAFHSYQDARDCHAAHGDGKSFIDGYRLRMQLVDDKDSIRATKAIGSPPRRKPPPKKTIEEEAADVIMTELKEVFMKDVRSRIVTPMLFDLLDPSHYKDIQPKSASSISPVKVLRPDPKVSVTTISPVKREPSEIPMNRRAMNALLPRFRKKGTEPAKGDSVRDRKPTKADVRPMHHQFNHYSDSEEDELPQREQSVMTDDEDDSSRPSREATSVSTPEPTRPKEIFKSHLSITDVPSVKGDESEEELLKDILETTKDEIHRPLSKRKRVVDFTSSEDEDESTPPKKICVEPELSNAMRVDEPVAPKPSKAALLKIAKVKAAALRRAKKAEAKVQEVEDSIVIETIPEKEVKVPIPAKPKVAEVNLAEIEGDDDMLLDLDGVQALVRDREDWRYLKEAASTETPELIRDIWTWSWKQKKLKALNFDGAQGRMEIPEPPAYNRINPSGSARTEGYVKIPEAEKSLYLPQRNKAIIPIGSEAARKTSRMNRVNNRRLAADMEVQKKTLSTESDILRFNQLKARKKQLKFARSPIHDWGLFAMEDIEAHEMVIEYVGEIIRFQIAELREKQYERIGIGSSYLFRVDDENIIDATKTGNIARFINHCCTPNCSAKIIQVQGVKKIVIYADRFIGAGEEITYDYKFPREDVKIPCFCGSAHCKGTLN